ncbi:MAG TPA: Cu(I)-responsive transcriptional regulator [Devosiaceae bacterium]|nr:Cu(I)-responsive transcriptional regulator [Devosiaceae bacterium]
MSMQIGQAARASGVSTKMIRHYEAIGLIPAADRRSSNYRDYDHDDIHRLGFIRRARDLGFSMPEIRDLLRLWGEGNRSSAEVKQLAEKHITDLDARIGLLREMRDTLSILSHACDGDSRPHCPIIESLAGEVPLPRPQLAEPATV